MNQIKLFILLLQFWTTWSRVKWAGIQPRARGIVWTVIMKVQTREMWGTTLKQSMLTQLAPPAISAESSQRPEKQWKCTNWDNTSQTIHFAKSKLWNKSPMWWQLNPSSFGRCHWWADGKAGRWELALFTLWKHFQQEVQHSCSRWVHPLEDWGLEMWSVQQALSQ